MKLHTAPPAWSRTPPGLAVHPGPPVNAWSAAPETSGNSLVNPHSVNPHPIAAHSVTPHSIAALLAEAWWSEGFHGTGTVRARPIPSAGGCYPVQTHVLTAADGASGRFVYDHQANQLIRVGDTNLAAGTLLVLTVLPQRTAGKYHHRAWTAWIADSAYALTALAAVAARSGLHTTRLRGTPAALAAMAGLPTVADWPQRWPGSAPELAVTALYLGETDATVPATTMTATIRSSVRAPQAIAAGPPPTVPALSAVVRAFTECARVECVRDATVVPVLAPAISRDALRRRRSMPFAAMTAPRTTVPFSWSRELRHLITAETLANRPPGCRVQLLIPADPADADALTEAVDRSSAQTWLRHCDLLVLFTAPRSPDSPPASLVHQLWWASLASAGLLYRAIDAPLRTRSRPVAGWTDARGDARGDAGSRLLDDRILHGLALWRPAAQHPLPAPPTDTKTRR
ncbi:hypothetical protein [Cryobacterium sp. PH29-G1]|uniref:hypothetical protein n=1 Tax=Cryobacterium sp. PH29-G1 TaxID=3046211 RepID=UPI0024B8C64D|nr:hypothetical protein [Cryobacterium sp. PH29-G1]MDJ0350245.1 hypothetical protein [Cryobacterium sp. PH29-G1]